MLFWIKNFIFALVLIGLAYYLIANEEELFGEQGKVSEDVIQADAKKREQGPKITKKNTNKAAQGLSRFYANLHGTDDGDGPRVRNNIVYLPEPTGDLVELLEARRLVTRALRKNWKSDVENRPFRRGQTLHQKIVEYANAEGLEVIWWLDRDFLVKDPFRINKEIVETAYRVGIAIEGHFQDGLSTYFCYQQRTLVFIEKKIDYLDQECTKLPRKSRSRSY